MDLKELWIKSKPFQQKCYTLVTCFSISAVILEYNTSEHSILII